MPPPDDAAPPPSAGGSKEGPEKRPSAAASWRASMKQAEPYLGLGMQMALSMTFFVFAGYWLDEWLGTSPWLLIGGALLGMVAIFVFIFRLSAELSARDRADKAKEPPPEPPAG